MKELKLYLKEKKDRIDQRLENILGEGTPEFSRLFDSMKYSLTAGGKRIRPILFLAVLEALGKESEAYLDTACTLECIHTYSLIHDDLPAMDNDEYRRGKLTNHMIYGAGMATLAGDGLLTYAFELLAGQPLSAEIKLELIQILARAAGPYGMVGGQAFDMESETRRLSLEELACMHKAKTGEMFKASILMGAAVGQANANTRRSLEAYADALGLVFQITDDILDVIGDEALIGKPVGSDEKNHKATYVTIFSVDKARELAKEYAEQGKNALHSFGKEADVLRKLMDYLLVRVS